MNIIKNEKPAYIEKPAKSLRLEGDAKHTTILHCRGPKKSNCLITMVHNFYSDTFRVKAITPGTAGDIPFWQDLKGTFFGTKAEVRAEIAKRMEEANENAEKAFSQVTVTVPKNDIPKLRMFALELQRTKIVEEIINTFPQFEKYCEKEFKPQVMKAIFYRTDCHVWFYGENGLHPNVLVLKTNTIEKQKEMIRKYATLKGCEIIWSE